MMPGKLFLFYLRLLASLFLLLPLSLPAASLTDQALLDVLRGGGYSLYFRHASTEWSQSDDVRKADDWLSCEPAQMRQLSERGRADAILVGDAIRRLGLPIATVVASPYCRTMETARLMKLGPVSATTEVMNLRSAEYFGGSEAVVASAQGLFARPPPRATNRVIVAHGNVARAAIRLYPDEGEALVLKADGNGGFSVIGRIKPGDWSRLLELET